MPGSTEYGAAFEHFIFMELRAHATYSPRDCGLPVSYWRTASGIEVDFILGNAEVALEAKSTDRPASDHLKGLRAWHEEHPRSRCILVCRAPRARRAEQGIEILPWREFLASLWRNEIRAG
jgi:predicted AAA+ superfamily ATPase